MKYIIPLFIFFTIFDLNGKQIFENDIITYTDPTMPTLQVVWKDNPILDDGYYLKDIRNNGDYYGFVNSYAFDIAALGIKN